MKIGIDISQIVYPGTGVARFTNGLVNAILDYDKENRWSFFFSGFRQKLDKALEQKIKANGHQLIKWQLPPALLSFIWNDLHRQLKIDVDWFITSDWTEPYLTDTKKATIIHDLTYLRYPDTVDDKIRKVQEKRLQWVKQESKIIFADSVATQKDLVEFLHVDIDKIVVNYPGVEAVKPSETDIKLTLKKYNLTKPFILTVGKLEPRKNLKRLITAFQQCNNPAIDLVIVGPSGWGDSIRRPADKNLKLLGYVDDAKLYSLYSSALFFIYPSIWEGFGYPIVEAMQLGTPVACSNVSSMKEIVDDAAVLFDPRSVNDITNRIKTIAGDGNLRKELVAKGSKRSKIFSWHNYYNKLIQTLYDNRC